MADVLRSAITNPAYHDIFAIIKGARNGLVYGAKVRFPHALIMAILFGRGSYRDRARTIVKATRQHAFNLARFVSVYKTALLVQKTLAGGKQRKADTFFAGLLGGWCIFGERNAINEQIVLYVVSRVITSFLPRATPPQPPKLPPGGLSAATSAAGVPPPPGFPYARPRPPNSKLFEAYAALSWGAVMWLFAERRDTLQTGMINSMQYLYLDSEVWSPIQPLKTLFWHNR